MSAPSEPPDFERTHAAWRTWLGALGTDPEAAISAALTYDSLDDDERVAWLDALDADAPRLCVPCVAVYAPLLAVERDEGRRARIAAAMGPQTSPTPARRALRSITSSGEHVCAIIMPLYLDFVELLICRYHPDEGVVRATHDPLQSARAFVGPCEVDGETLSEAGIHEVIEDLAHAVVADQRRGRVAPDALVRFAELFDLTGCQAST